MPDYAFLPPRERAARPSVQLPTGIGLEGLIRSLRQNTSSPCTMWTKRVPIVTDLRRHFGGETRGSSVDDSVPLNHLRARLDNVFVPVS